MKRFVLPAALGLALTACAPVMTTPDLTGSPLVTGQDWIMLTPAGTAPGAPAAQGSEGSDAKTAAQPVQLSRQLTVGTRELQADGTVAYTAPPRPTTTGSTQDLFRFVPRGEGRSMIVAGQAESSFDLRFYDFCVVRSVTADVDVDRAQSGVYVQTTSLDALWTNRTYQSYANSGVAAGLKPCTLTRVK